MAKAYRPVLRDQVFLLPPDMRDWLPADHLVWFLLETIEVLDTSEFERRRRRGGAGAAGYDPRMLLGLLIFAYCRGIRSSRQVERLCHIDVAFRVLCAQDIPDHCTIARFRTECQDAFTTLFTQVLLIAGRAGLGHFGTVAIDGTKIPANASIDANRGHEWLSQQVERMVTEAQAIDGVEDKRTATHDGQGDRVPSPLVERSERASKRSRRTSLEPSGFGARTLDAETQCLLVVPEDTALPRDPWRAQRTHELWRCVGPEVQLWRLAKHCSLCPVSQALD